MKKLIAIGIFIINTLLLSAQSPTTIILNGTIHTGTGTVIENGVLVMEGSKIISVGTKLESNYKNARIIDAKGKHVYPGLVCMNNIMGLNEIDAIKATHDYNERGDINPNVRALIAFNTDSKILPTAVYNGILYTQAVPQGGLVSGTSSLMKTQGWNWEDAVVGADDGVHLNWPQLSATHEEHNKEVEKQVELIKTFFAEASQYASQKEPLFNARFNAMKGVLAGEKNLYIHTGEVKSMIRSINFFRSNYPKIKLVLVGAQDAYLIPEFLVEQKVPVVLGNIHRLPSRNAEGIDQPYQTPGQLQNAGITLALSYEGSWESRNLAYIAGTAAAYGMNKEEALKAITLTPAQIMGSDKRIGSLEAGKDASIIICNGDLLDMKSSALFMVFLEGKELNLQNDQVLLYKKYMNKYGLE